jgi:superfamily II DNA or RNA helicase
VEVQKIVADGCNKHERIYANGQMAFAEMIGALATDPRRNTILLDAIVEALKVRRKVIVVTSLVAHALALREAMEAREKALVIATMAGPRIESEKAKDPATRLVFASYAMLEEGYDDPVLDCLVLATPRSRIQQTVGRIERTMEGKLKPLVVDIVDPFSIYPNMWAKRQAFYKSRGFAIS